MRNFGVACGDTYKKAPSPAKRGGGAVTRSVTEGRGKRSRLLTVSFRAGVGPRPYRLKHCLGGTTSKAGKRIAVSLGGACK